MMQAEAQQRTGGHAATGIAGALDLNLLIVPLVVCALVACGSRPVLRLPPRVAGQIPAGYELGEGRGVVLARFSVTTQGEPGFGAITNPLVVELREQGAGEPADETPQGLTLTNDNARVFTAPRTVPTLWRYGDSGLMVASFRPGTYDGLVIAYPDVQHPELPDSIPAPSQGLRFRPIEVPADTIVYIGDIQLRQHYSFWDRPLDRIKVDYAIRDHFEPAVADLRARYPQFAAAPVEKRLASAVETAP
jgi:hypothetical protein